MLMGGGGGVGGLHHRLFTVTRSLHKKDLHKAACSVHRIHTHTHTRSHHSVTAPDGGCDVHLIDDFVATRCVCVCAFVPVCLCLCTRQREVGRRG